jgi:hypothetical protein
VLYPKLHMSKFHVNIAGGEHSYIETIRQDYGERFLAKSTNDRTGRPVMPVPKSEHALS